MSTATKKITVAKGHQVWGRDPAGKVERFYAGDTCTVETRLLEKHPEISASNVAPAKSSTPKPVSKMNLAELVDHAVAVEVQVDGETATTEQLQEAVDSKELKKTDLVELIEEATTVSAE